MVTRIIRPEDIERKEPAKAKPRLNVEKFPPKAEDIKVRISDKKIRGIDRRTGEEAWNHSYNLYLPPFITETPGERLYVNNGENIEVLNRATGKVMNRTELGSREVSEIVDECTGFSFFASHYDGVGEYSYPDFNPIWEDKKLGIVCSLAKHGNTLFAASLDAGLCALDSTSGELKWRKDGRFQTVDVDNKGNVYACVKDKGANAFDITGKNIWKERGSDNEYCHTTGIHVGKDKLYVSNRFGEVRSLDLKSGDKVWERKYEMDYPYRIIEEGNYLEITGVKSPWSPEIKTFVVDKHTGEKVGQF